MYLRHDRDWKKHGQIAHINHQPEDSSIDNLAFLCLDHHDEYDSSASSSRKLTATELKYYRDLLYKEAGNLVAGYDARGNTPLEVLEELIAAYYDDGSQYTAVKLYITPGLDDLLALVDRRELLSFCRQSGRVHLVHPEKGLGILPNRTMQQFFEMESALKRYEAAKILSGYDSSLKDRTQTIERWIDIRVDEAYGLVCNYLAGPATAEERGLFAVPAHIGFMAGEGSRLSRFFGIGSGPTRALMRFAFHVGGLYRCAPDHVLVCCADENECNWFRVLDAAASKIGPLCDAWPGLPHNDVLVLPPLRVRLCSPDSREIVAAVTSELGPAAADDGPPLQGCPA